jgi:CRP-like cAMP-binding protein
MKAIASSKKRESKAKRRVELAFDAVAFLHSAGVARKVVEFPRSRKIYSQGEPATSVMYIQDGGVKLSVVNEVGKEAVVAIRGHRTFLERGAWQARNFLWGRPRRLLPRLSVVLHE